MRSMGMKSALALACAGIVGTAFAVNVDRGAPLRAGEIKALAAAGESGAFAQRLASQEKRLELERTYYPILFKAAYAKYPRIPAGTLEALAYAQTRWHHVQPTEKEQKMEHAHMPQGWGVMGLYEGDGFSRQVSEGAALLGTTVEQVKRNPGVNIMAAAALLDRELSRSGVMRAAAAGDDAIAGALQRYAGFGGDGKQVSNVENYARASFAYDVLLSLDRGVNDNGIKVPMREVQWERSFDAPTLQKLNAPMVRLDVQKDRVEAGGYTVDPISEQLVRSSGGNAGMAGKAAPATDVSIQSADYGPAIWAPSPNYSSRNGTAVREVVIHTCQGGYSGCVSWLRNTAANASAHYVVRSSDGQISQLVREANKAWHARSHNPYSIGIEHEGFVNNPSWYTNAMYNASAGIVRNACARYAGVTCSTAYKGASTSYGGPKIGDQVDIKGHQHLTDNTHTDPGIHWNWSKYYGLLNPSTPPPQPPPGGGDKYLLLDGFESSMGHFVTQPTYSGSTVGISTASSSSRDCSERKAGTCSMKVTLRDGAGSGNWEVRHLSGSGNPASNTALTRNGYIGFWVLSGGSGMSVGVTLDDSDGSERSVSRAIPAGKWTYVEWKLADAAQWNAWASGNGAITASSVKLDAVWFYRAQTSYPVHLYVDNVQLRY